eukprot:13255268-Heterocapsa_arctica.AAC.2
MGMMYKDIETPGVSDQQLAKMLGNSMSVNVLERLLSRCLLAVGLLKWDACHHSWESQASAVRRVRELRG